MRTPPHTQFQRVPVRVEWRVTPVIGGGTKEFAQDLEAALNGNTAEGFSLSHMFQYNAQDMVLVHQRTTLVGIEDPDSLAVESRH